MQPNIHTLSNGLQVIFIDTKAFPTLTTLLLVGAGSRYENPKNNGIAHFFEHMAFKGSRKYENAFVISSTIDTLGGVFNAFTSKDHTGYWIKAPTEDFEVVVDVLSDMVLYPKLLQEEIDREKGVIIEEINMYEDTPYRKVGEAFETLLYKGNPLGYDIAGTKETVNSFTRDTFVNYIDQLYHPKNAVLIVAGGNAGTKEHIKLIEDKFGAWNADGKTKMEYEKMVEKQKKPQMMVQNKKTEQAHYCLGYRAFSYYDDRRTALSVLSAILGGGMSSRLFTEVREKRGLCYYISTGRELYSDVGNIVTQAGITNDLEKIKESIQVIIKEHQKIAAGDVSDDELYKAREFLKGRFLLSMEDSFNIASFFGNKKLLEGGIEMPEEIVKRLERIKKDEVVALAKELFIPENLNFTMVGPYKESDLKGVLEM